ncbi:protein ABHD15-like [Mizuhopecten yessoensis]|uniref:Abhydrolase domain-containing protein 15 n=1 Tax=Mizuhopecten yessoensis TaxID=6573 RepID=A0A210PQN0_MIZYE|nr:protein ABHD15-like [Mizuhopecten yessoensis]XP_021377694.1 protein ABHD15-like [Mizuhopecten yessoensis]XP_021377695.1 protein ABHD15-like [Mizuhopecten yessoensis]XP_021377696.1 protein ABHD15-like [Mizuhopecten yessoensis]OWF38793.1 Abhydrolase domain-containing protein 15 [Mizuhopecten yessoensis]
MDSMVLLPFMMPLPVALTLVCTSVLAVMLYVRSFFTSTDTLPKMYYKESTLNTHLLNKSSIMRRPFRPSFWLKNRHVQTFLGCVRPQSIVHFEREYLQLSDKGVVALDWVIGANYVIRRNSPICIVFPSLTGDANSVSDLCACTARKGFRTVVFNSRGHGNSFLTTKKLQSFGDPLDVRQSVLYIHQKHQRSHIVAVAMGSGSTVLFSYLGEYGSSTRLKATAFISPVYDTTQTLIRGMSKFYEFSLLSKLKFILFKHAHALSEVVDMAKAMLCGSMLTFQEQVYCRSNESLDQFLERNDPMRDVDDISVPVLCVNSTDDPICKHNHTPFDIFQFYPNMLLVATDHGGHCGFLESVHRPSWTDKLVVDYLASVLEFTSKGYEHSG